MSSDYQPTPEKAKSDLSTVHDLAMRGIQKGMYSKRYAFWLAIWGGLITATIGMAIWPLLFVFGLMAHLKYKQQKGAWIQEINSSKDMWIVIGLSVIAGGAMIGSYISRTYYELTWVPYLGGIFVFVLLLAITEKTYGAQWAASKEALS